MISGNGGNGAGESNRQTGGAGLPWVGMLGRKVGVAKFECYQSVQESNNAVGAGKGWDMPETRGILRDRGRVRASVWMDGCDCSPAEIFMGKMPMPPRRLSRRARLGTGFGPERRCAHDTPREG